MLPPILKTPPTLVKFHRKRDIHFSKSAPFCIKPQVFQKYFVHGRRLQEEAYFFSVSTNNAQFLALIRLKWPVCHYHATIFLDYEKTTQINLLFLSLVLKLQFFTILNFFRRALDSFKNIWDKVLKNGPSEILSSTNFTWSILEYFVPFWN